MKFEKNTPKVDCLKGLKHFEHFLQLGQDEFCDFLKKFLISSKYVFSAMS